VSCFWQVNTYINVLFSDFFRVLYVVPGFFCESGVFRAVFGCLEGNIAEDYL
jgi:hypothetical protein